MNLGKKLLEEGVIKLARETALAAPLSREPREAAR
jgi:hypothetical protein